MATAERMTGTLSADTETFRLPRGPWLLIGLVMYLPVILLVHRAVDIAVCLFPVSMFVALGWVAGVVRVSRHGLVLYWVNRGSWVDFTAAERRRVFWLPYLYAMRRRGLSWWIPLYFVGRRGLRDALLDMAPVGNPVRAALEEQRDVEA